MKMVKKILFGLVAVAAVLSLASCGIKKDDPEGIIKGTAGNYSVNYKYENTDQNAEYRAYKPTAYRHAGELAKVTFKKADLTNAGNSKLGVIFGLKETNSGNTKLKNFYIIGIGLNPSGDGGRYYFSKFENIADIQAKNFGASDTYNNSHESSTLGDHGEKETLLSWSSEAPKGIQDCTLYTDAEDNLYIYIWYQVQQNGTISIKIGDISDTNVNAWKAKKDSEMVDISPDFAGTPISYTTDVVHTPWTPQSTTVVGAPQDYPAIYARVQGGKTLNGTVKFVKDFCEAEDIEPID